MKNFYFYLSCAILGVLFGLAAAWAGVDLTSARGWPLLAVWILWAGVHAVRGACLGHRAYCKGKEDALVSACRAGWFRGKV